MTNGIVKNWNSSECWGFIIGDDGEDYFLHISNVRSGQNIANDCRVKFDITQGHRGPEAENVTLY